MPWPGAPANQQSPPINPPSQRTPPALDKNSSMGDVAEAVNKAFEGLLVHEQAFAALPAQIAAQAKAAVAVVENVSSEAVAGVISFNTLTGPVIYFPGLGTVNDQLGAPSYAPVQGDAGAKIIVGDSSPVTINLSPSLATPWFAMIGNDSGATVNLVADSGAQISGIQAIYPGGFVFIFFDGSTFRSEGVAVPTYRAVIPISSAQILDMYANPVFLVGPPSGYDITMVSMIVRFYPGPTNTPYSFSNPNEIVIIGLGGAGATQSDLYDGDYYSMAAAGFVDQTAINNNAIWVPVNGSGSLEPEGCGFWMTTGQVPLTGGDGTIVVYLDYHLA